MRQGLLRVLAVGLFFAAGCGGAEGGFPAEEDASSGDDASIDAGPLPTFDVPSTSQDNGSNPPADTGTNPPRDNGSVNPPTDNGVSQDRGGGGGVCPPSCQSNADCNPCRDPSDPPGSEYCCMSGLCLYMNGACQSNPTGDAGVPGGNDGGGDDGGGTSGDGGGGLDDVNLGFDDASADSGTP